MLAAPQPVLQLRPQVLDFGRLGLVHDGAPHNGAGLGCLPATVGLLVLELGSLGRFGTFQGSGIPSGRDVPHRTKPRMSSPIPSRSREPGSGTDWALAQPVTETNESI